VPHTIPAINSVGAASCRDTVRPELVEGRHPEFNSGSRFYVFAFFYSLLL